MTRRAKIGVSIAVVVFVLLALPVKVTCGAPNFTCTSAPDDEGKVSRVVDIEPLSVYILEVFVKDDLPVKYFEYKSLTQVE